MILLLRFKQNIQVQVEHPEMSEHARNPKCNMVVENVMAVSHRVTFPPHWLSTSTMAH